MIGGDIFFFLVVDCIKGETCFDDVIVHVRLGGDMLFFFLHAFVFFIFLFYLCSCFTNYGILSIIYIMRLFMVYVFYFMFCETLKFILCVYGLFSVSEIYKLIHSKLFSTLATDG